MGVEQVSFFACLCVLARPLGSACSTAPNARSEASLMNHSMSASESLESQWGGLSRACDLVSLLPRPLDSRVRPRNNELIKHRD